MTDLTSGEVPEAASRGRPDRAGAPVSPGTLLIVDDLEENREILARFLEAKGYRVLQASGGEEALRLVEQQPVDLLLLDVMMPGLSGTEVLRRLRERYEPTALPVIMATAKDRPEEIVAALALGANDYVTKPLDLTVLLARTETQLAVKRLTNELELRNRFIRRVFGRYLSEEVVSSLLATPEGLQLGGSQQTVTLLMSDLRGFTALADKLAPEQVVRLLNNYLGAMVDVITRFHGTIDEFVGDGIMALFGAPVARPDDASRAVACAVAMQLAMASVNARNQADGLPEVQMGVAVNTGDVIVGNIGSHKRTKYGVVGTHVNLTARIESFTLGGQVLVSEATLKAAGTAIAVGEQLTFRAKGFTAPVTVYEVRGANGPWRLRLPERVRQLQPLRRPLPVRFQVIHGTHAQGERMEGEVLAASLAAALVRSAEAAVAHTELRLSLPTPEGGEPEAELYGRVTADPAEPGCFVVSFSSVPPDVAQIIQEALVGGIRVERLR